MDAFLLLVRTARWIRRRPTLAQVLIAGGVILAAGAVYVAERHGAWPDALTLEPAPRRPGVPARHEQ
jgi:hypothetical protein